MKRNQQKAQQMPNAKEMMNFIAAIQRNHTTYICWEEIAEEFAQSNSGDQAVFLFYLSKSITKFMPKSAWDFQCRAITDVGNWDEEVRRKLIMQLETLVDHLKDPTR